MRDRRRDRFLDMRKTRADCLDLATYVGAGDIEQRERFETAGQSHQGQPD
jgi:hypothetical protein